MNARRFASTVLVLFASAAYANGDLFFEAMEVPGQAEYVVFGNVKTDDGKYLANALVTVNIKEPFLTYTSETDVLGRFRTLDVGRAIKGLGYSVDPLQIEVVAEYPGYRLKRRVYRGKYGQNKGAVEMNFIMEKNGE